MNTADIVLLAVILLSALTGMMRGFVLEVVSLATLFAAILIAKLFCEPLGMMLAPWIELPSLRTPAGFMALFIATLFVGGLVKRLLREFIRAVGLTGTDRVLGLGFGALRGLVLAVVALGLASRMTSMPQDPWWKSSRVIPAVMSVETSVNDTLGWAWDRLSASSKTTQ